MDIAKGQDSPPFSLYREPRMLKGMNEMDNFKARLGWMCCKD
jgi:hypothetical protein